MPDPGDNAQRPAGGRLLERVHLWSSQRPVGRTSRRGTTSTEGLKVYAQLDENAYERGIKISDTDLATVNLHPNTFHGEWNYTIKPTT